MSYKIAVIKGDGIGTEIADSAIAVLEVISKKFNLKFDFEYVLAGGISIDTHGVPLTDEALNTLKCCDSVLLAAVGGPKWDTLAGHLRPERALLAIRKELGLYANIRPSKLFDSLKNASPLKKETVDNGFDLVIVRELTGGMYYGERGRFKTNGVESAFDTETYSTKEIERICKTAFSLSLTRNKKVTSIDKANVLESSRLWREVFANTAKSYPQVEVSNMLVDNAAMQLIKNPKQFDVIVTSNMFGDILSDEASQLTGSIGMIPSVSIGDGKRGMYEPIHGSAPDIAGKNIANPIATILSAAMMLEYSFDEFDAAKAIEIAVEKTLNEGFRTGDIAEIGIKPIGTKEMTKRIIERIES